MIPIDTMSREIADSSRKVLFQRAHPYFRTWPAGADLSFDILKTGSGAPTARVIHRGQEAFLHSRYDPEEEAARLVRAFKPGPDEVIFLLGPGLGYPLAAFRSLYPENLCVVLERERTLFDLFMARAAVSLLEDPDIFYFSWNERGMLHQLIPYLYHIRMKKKIRFRIFRYQPVCSLFQADYDCLEKTLLEEISAFYSNCLTEAVMRPLWERNSRKNYALFNSSARLSELKNAFCRKPMIIVSAGPSLEKNIGFVREKREGAVLLCVDTALRYLVRQGLVPDYVLCLDAKYENLFDFKYLKTGERTELIYDIVSFPKIAPMFSRRRVTYTLRMVWDFIRREYREMHEDVLDPLMAGAGDWGGLQSGGSVSTNAFDLALFTGADPVYFVGLDLAYRNYKTHCRGSFKEAYLLPRANRFYNYETLNFLFVVNRENIRTVKDGDVIHHDFILRKYRRWFEQAFSLVRGKRRVEVIGETP